jgi:hypothetical protein
MFEQYACNRVGKTAFCSRDCYSRNRERQSKPSKRAIRSRPCKICARLFRPAKSDIKAGNGKYCSRSCQAKGVLQTPAARAKRADSYRCSLRVQHKIEMVCDGCGVRFWEYPYKRPKPLKFCCRACCLQYQRAKTPTADMDSTAPPKRAEPGLTVVYDPVRKELRNG